MPEMMVGVDEHLRRRRFGGQQTRRFEVGPQRCRDVELEHVDAFVELRSRAAADDDAADRGGSHWKLQRRRFQRHIVSGAYIANSTGSLDELGGEQVCGGWGARGVVGGAWSWVKAAP